MGDSMERSGNFGHGYWEDREFKQVNMSILQMAGGDWANPPSREAIMEAGLAHRNMCELLVKRRDEKRPLWGWKDPRNCLTLPVWLQFVDPDTTHIVGVFRRPSQVARSLTRREGWEHEQGFELAREYNRRLLREIELFLEA